MNIANVTSRFALLSGVDKSEAYKWRVLIDDAVDYISSVTIKKNPDSCDTARLEMLCAVYAFRLYSLCRDENISSFVAGDVRVTSSDNAGLRGEQLWAKYSERSKDLIDTEGFLFGRIS